jgi:hypothetical protein
VLVVIRYWKFQDGEGQKFTEVIIPVCPVKTATGTPVCKSQIRRIRSMEPAASRVFSKLMAMSVISEEAPRNVAMRRPVRDDHNFINKSSAP